VAQRLRRRTSVARALNGLERADQLAQCTERREMRLAFVDGAAAGAAQADRRAGEMAVDETVAIADGCAAFVGHCATLFRN
jgi:hypothetical protein